MTRLFFSLLAALLVAGCSGGIGGTGTRAEGGIGGTGAPASEVTLFGVITDFGSIWVNGVEVHYDRSTPIELNGAPELALGQTVLVQARAFSGNEARATSIRVADAVVGPVTATDAARGLVYVAGRPVRIDASTPRGAGVPADLPRAGETLRVSGLATADGTIAATRIERAPPRERAGAELTQADLRAPRFVVQGYVGQVAARELRIGALTLESEPSVRGSLSRDQLVRVSGRNENGRLVVERAERLSSAFPPRGERPGARPGSGERGERGDRGGSDRPDRSGPDRPDRPDRGGGGDRPDRPDRSGKH